MGVSIVGFRMVCRMFVIIGIYAAWPEARKEGTQYGVKIIGFGLVSRMILIIRIFAVKRH